MPNAVNTEPLAIPILIIAGVAVLLCVLAIWLILRARKPLKLPTLTDAIALGAARRKSAWARVRHFIAEAIVTLRYVSARREWRYQIPWVLVCGETGGGKSSLATSITSGRRVRLTEREQELPFTGSAWHFFERGVLIDIDGASLPGQDDGAGHAWRDVLTQINDLRPERSFDAAVLVLSARTLLKGSAAEVQRLAERCHTQLWELQQRCELAFPVYVVVTQCDAVEGFSAFWTPQSEKRRQEIFGWSNPYSLENNFVVEWLDDAFAQMGSSLKMLQLQAAAADVAIAQPDEFFLFPQRFRELQTPLRSILDGLLRGSAYEPTAFCRGIYFTGSVVADGAKVNGPRDDVAFVERLFEEKVFAELNLARPTRHGIWSRHRLIRRVQYATVGIFAALCLGLAQAGFALHRQVDAGVTSFNLIKHPQRMSAGGAAACIDKTTVYELLTNVATLDVSLIYIAIPASWVDRHISRQGAQLISDRAFEQIIFPALACELMHRARQLVDESTGIDTPAVDSLSADQEQLKAYLDRVLAFERNLARLKRIVAYTSHDESDELLQKLNDLMVYLYGEPLPSTVYRRQGQHREALAKVEYNASHLDMPATQMRAHIGKRLARLSEHVREELSRQVDAGEVLLQKLLREQEPVLATAKRLDQWLSQMRSDWLASSEQSNPCQRVGSWFGAGLTELQRDFNYDPALRELTAAFSTERCYAPSMRRLAELHVPPHGVLFRRAGDHWELAPALAAEAEGLKALINLDFMQLAARTPFTCQVSLRGWRATDLAEADRFMREYQEFARKRGADDNEAVAQSLYLRVARRHLRAVLDENLTRAQRRVGYADTGMLEPLSGADQEMTQQSGELARTLEPLLWAVRMRQQLGDDAGHIRIVQCARNYAFQSLQTLHGLAETSRLYEPEIDRSGGDDKATRPFFVLGGEPQTKEYLDRQLQRAQWLSAQAAPFVTLLKNTDGISDAAVNPGNSGAYWENTIQEVNRHVQFKVPNGQVGLLNDLFTKQLSKLTPENCDQQLAASAEGYGNDLFSRRRRSLEQQAQWQCHDRTRANAYAQYEAVARQFSSDLAGRFPFGSAQAGDASVAAARNFLLDYAKQRNAVRAKLNGVKGENVGEVTMFLDRVDEVAAFFGPSIAAGDGAQPMRVKVEFRVLPRQSVGAENIVSWRFSAGNTAASHPNGKTEIEWRTGQAVSLALTWADLAGVAPTADTRQPDMRVSGNVVAFDADGPWALLKLMQRHIPVQSPRFDPTDPNMVLLEFRVPTESKQPTDAAGGTAADESRLYIGLRFLGVDPKTQAVTVLKPPRAFPYYAPVW